MKALSKGRYIFKNRWGVFLVEMEILEVSKKAYLVRYRNGYEKWIDKFELSGDSCADYELYEKFLTNKEDES